MKKIISIFLILMMLFSAIPANASASTVIDDGATLTEISVRGITLKSGDYLENGKSAPQNSQPEGGYAYFNDGVLILNGFSYEGSRGYSFINGTSAIIYCGASPVTIYLKGNNYIRHTALGYGIASDGNVTIGGTGSLKINNDYAGIYLKGAADLTINSGIFELDSIRGSGLSTSKGSIIINGGTICSRNNGIHYEDYYYWAVNHGTGSLYIADGITVQASTDPDGTPGAFDPANIKTYDYVVIIDERDTGSFIPGDINGDSTINGKDSNQLKQKIAGAIEFDPGSREVLAADLNEDSEINAKDSNLLKRIIAGDLAY